MAVLYTPSGGSALRSSASIRQPLTRFQCKTSLYVSDVYWRSRVQRRAHRRGPVRRVGAR
ncbi:hypothetical protein J6590_003287 [Homalodisca vitripennis]|nr:hypothetical protein J6590_003287 [Homalodisca vitripennis]